MIYGHDILFRKAVQDAEVDENGDLVLHDAEWGEPEQCDAEPAQGKASTLTLPDGTRRQYSYVVVMDVDAEPFDVGDHIMLLTHTHAPDMLRVKDKTQVLDREQAKVYIQAAREYEVLGFHRYQFQCKLWI